MQCKAAQLQPEEDSHSERVGRSKSSHLPPDRPGVPGAWPSRAGSVWEPVAGRGAQSYDSPSGQLGSRWPGTLHPISAPQGTNPAGLFVQVCRMGLQQVVGRAPRGGTEKIDPQVSGSSPADGCRHPASFLGPRPPRSLSPALCKPAPNTHNPQDSLGPKGHFHTRQVATSRSSPPSSASTTAPAPTVKIS